MESVKTLEMYEQDKKIVGSLQKEIHYPIQNGIRRYLAFTFGVSLNVHLTAFGHGKHLCIYLLQYIR